MKHFSEGDSFTIDAELYVTGKSFRYDASKQERRIRPIKGQIRKGIEVSQNFNIECSRYARYSYPMETIFRLDVTVCRKTNKTSFYNYFDEYYLRSYNQNLQSVAEYESRGT
jgi:hypothetical protein